MKAYRNSDIQAVLERDPAVHSSHEVRFCYPGYKAIKAYRFAHRLYQYGHIFLARLISARALRKTGIDIHPGARIGSGLFIDHGQGVVIGETAEIGDNVTIYQGVTLGGTGKDLGKRHPTIGNNVTIGAGAKVLGPIQIGNHVKIGAGSIVLKDVPDECTVVGNPGRIVKSRRTNEAIDLDQVHLPDPMLDRINEMEAQIKSLQEKIK